MKWAANHSTVFMAEPHDSSRREFLTGRVIQKEMRRAGDGIADSLSDADLGQQAPIAGDTVRLETKAMGCPWSVIMNPGPPRQVMVATDAFDFVRDVEQVLTIYRDDSEVAHLNREATSDWHTVSDELFQFLQTCQQLYEATDGAFDPATGALINLWNSARDQGRIPFTGELEEALANSGMENISLNSESSQIQFQRPGLLLDFASIGKGYGIDRAAEHILNEEVENYLVHGGQSSLFAAGGHFGHDGWPIGLKNPLFTEKRYATILLKDQGMATSGSNIQFFRYEGKRYGHLLDPRNGMPAEGILSVTVIAPTATEADALSTAFYVMGLETALKYCDDHPEIGAVIIPTPSNGRLLEPYVKNFPLNRIFFEQ